MKRDYEDGVGVEVTLFTGIEIEKTPAYGMKTLFVVGVQDSQHILDMASAHECTHIYLGANQSFKLTHRDYEQWQEWDAMVKDLLAADILVTLDFDVSLTETVLEYGWTERNNFIPMISVKLGYIQQLGYNASLKLDDTDFKASNPGVWVHQVHDLMDRSKFTDWREYKQDQVIETTFDRKQ